MPEGFSERSYEAPRRREDESHASLERLRSREGVVEYLSNNGNRRELIRYSEFLTQIGSFVRTLPPSEQEQAAVLIDREITTVNYQEQTEYIAPPTHTDKPSEPAVQAPPPQATMQRPVSRVACGEHMDVTLGYQAAACWPDREQVSLSLSDGAIITPEDYVGIIDYYRNIKSLTRDDSLVRFSRELISSAIDSLKFLAQASQRMDRHPVKPEAFSGMSHLARLASRFGFTVFDIPDASRQRSATETSFGIANSIGINSREWNRFRKNYKPAQVAIISTPELIKKYSKT